jgi:hypothetical protein
MFNQEILPSQVIPECFPFPCEGKIILAVRNLDYSLGPVMLHFILEPGSAIPAHLHARVAEVLYVVDGDLINEGKQYLPGTSLHVRPGQLHGPHSTERGCKVLVLWTAHAATQEANLGDFIIPKAVGAK